MELNGYELSRAWFDWCFENPEKINPNHSALYFFCIEHCNRLGWKKKFGLPTTMAKEAIGIKSYSTYIKTLNDLVDFGAIVFIEKSKNQYSSNIIALSNFNKALNKALDKALIKHITKHSESTGESISSIDKPLTINKEPLNKEQVNIIIPFDSDNFKNVWNQFLEMRKSIKKPLKEISQQAQLLKLSKFTEHDATEMILQSIQNGWQGIFELKNNNNNGKSNSSTGNKIGRINQNEILEFIKPRNHPEHDKN